MWSEVFQALIYNFILRIMDYTITLEYSNILRHLFWVMITGIEIVK